ncbi:3'-5' exonuclease [Streptomyces sp. NPDC094031]|uniref:3'-5' exonuclease n=1 Tax=Streptomyces sp. NPDC094031 TaxID=3155307 RepID=UPI003328EB8A
MDSTWTEGLVNVVDVEATCWAGSQPPGEVSEIIEIGLTVVDLDAGERLARHRILVKPARSLVSEFCTELTGLTQHEVDQGVTFAEACRLLAAEHHAGTRPWASWGDYDRHQFTRQCQAARTPYPFGRRHTNAKAVFTRAYGLRRRPGMAQALEIAGRRLEGRHHRGEDDAWNIAALVLHLFARGLWPAGTVPSGSADRSAVPGGSRARASRCGEGRI